MNIDKCCRTYLIIQKEAQNMLIRIDRKNDSTFLFSDMVNWVVTMETLVDKI